MDSDKLAAAVERAAEAALKRAPRGLDLGDLANNAAFHALVGWRLPKHGRRSNPLKQDFFQEILFDAMVEPEEAAQGIVGYLLACRKDALPRRVPSSKRQRRPTPDDDAMVWDWGLVAGMVLPMAALTVISELWGWAGLLGLLLGVPAVFLVGRGLWKSWKKARLASRIENATGTLIAKQSLPRLAKAQGESLAGGCAYVFMAGLTFVGAVQIVMLVANAHDTLAQSDEWRIFWVLGSFFGVLFGWWCLMVENAARNELERLEKVIEQGRSERHADGAPPKETS